MKHWGVSNYPLKEFPRCAYGNYLEHPFLGTLVVTGIVLAQIANFFASLPVIATHQDFLESRGKLMKLSSSLIRNYLVYTGASLIASKLFLYGRAQYSMEEKILFALLTFLGILLVLGDSQTQHYEREVSRMPEGKMVEANKRKEDAMRGYKLLRQLLLVAAIGGIISVHLFSQITEHHIAGPPNTQYSEDPYDHSKPIREVDFAWRKSDEEDYVWLEKYIEYYKHKYLNVTWPPAYDRVLEQEYKRLLLHKYYMELRLGHSARHIIMMGGICEGPIFCSERKLDGKAWRGLW